MKMNLKQIIGSGVVLAALALPGCPKPSYISPPPTPNNPSNIGDTRTQTQKRPAYTLEDECTAPKIIFRDNDPRFKQLTSENFILHTGGQTPFRMGWVFYGGENLTAGMMFPESFYGEKYCLIARGPGDKEIGTIIGDIGPGSGMYAENFEASTLLKKWGAGDYNFGWAISGNKIGRGPKFKLAAMQWFRIKEQAD